MDNTLSINEEGQLAQEGIVVQKLATALGAEVSGVDLTKELSDAQFQVIHDALCEHLVLFFRDQPMLPEHHKQFALRFGPVQTHPAYPHVEGYPEITILENTEANPSKIEKWHTDMTFRPTPPLGSILHAQAIPDFGGDTLFASMQAAYDALSDKMRNFLSGLTALHDFAYGFKESLAEEGGRERLAHALIDNPPVEHPVVRTHPVTGKKGLFVNCLFTRHIAGMKPTESDALLNFLYQHMILPEFSVRFKWQKHSIAFWDNRATQHKPVNDFHPAYRKMQRITIDGDRPY